MRAVIQRVTGANVQVAGEIVGTIGTGAVVLLGVAIGDTLADAEYVADKIAVLRLFESTEAGGPERSLVETGGAVLLISQFTLMGDTRKGRRPSWSGAARPDEARALYEAVQERLCARGLTVATGVFQAQMQVTLTNDGPYTLIVESKSAV